MIINGDSAKELKKFKDNSIDAVITDPPYGIEFLAKDWDSNTGAVEIWQECLRVLKPGGHLLAFSAARTYHILATNIQSVGFEIRDQIMWLYASGFPKAQDIGKAIDRRAGKRQGNKAKNLFARDNTRCEKCGKTNVQTGIGFDCKDAVCPFLEYLKPADNKWSGWKTALKPAHEPICMARKPMKGSTIDNVLKHGVGALNIDEARIPSEPFDYCADGLKRTTYSQSEPAKWNDSDKQMIRNNKGRFPSNVLGEIEGYQKFFYCPKVSRKERNIGCEDPGPQFQVPHGFDYRMPSKHNADPKAIVKEVEKTAPITLLGNLPLLLRIICLSLSFHLAGSDCEFVVLFNPSAQ